MKAIIKGKEVELAAFTVVTETPQETYLLANEWYEPAGLCRIMGTSPARIHERSTKRLYLVDFTDDEPLLA